MHLVSFIDVSSILADLVPWITQEIVIFDLIYSVFWDTLIDWLLDNLIFE